MSESRNKIKNTHLPPGFWLRPAVFEDLKSVTELIQTVDLEDLGETDFDEKELLESWQRPRFNVLEDAWVVETQDDQGHLKLVGYEELWSRPGYARLDGDGYVHPKYTGLGIGTALLRQLETRAREHILLAEPDLRVFVRNGMEARDKAGRKLHENEGYHPVRYFYRMNISLEKEPAAPQWPEGIELRTFYEGQERQAFETLEDSFRDHWGFTPWDYQDWMTRSVQQDDFEPGLFFLAWDGDELAGAALCRQRMEGGWVSQLGVRKPWRRLGLGMALLQQAFLEFYRLGITSIALGVDANSKTGATRLYERAGMHILHEFVVYEKELRPGRSSEED
jgi:mycothiol synthase